MSKKKVTGLIIAMFVLLAVAVSAVSYSIATQNPGEIMQLADANDGSTTIEGMDYISNIDLIIESLNNGEPYYIVEIVPSGMKDSDKTGFQDYVEQGRFTKYVLEAYSDKKLTVNANASVVYNSISVGPNTALQTSETVTDEDGNLYHKIGRTAEGELLDQADLIYVSCPGVNSYDGNNDMSEEVFSFLQRYARGSDKPIIMDYVTSGAVETAKTYRTIATAISKNHIRYRTFYWDQDVSVIDFLNGASYYIRQSASASSTGKILIISGAAEGTTDVIEQKLRDIKPNDFRSNAYSGNDDIIGNIIIDIERKAAGAVTAADLDGYDFVVIENSAGNTTISDDLYNKIRAMSESSKYILYDSKLINTTTAVDSTKNNYLRLMEYLITSNGTAKYQNVLATDHGFFASLNLMDADGVTAAKAVADILNNGDFRGSSKNGKNGKVFRVLEIQPCYPVDMDIATKNNRYYSKPSEMMTGVTKDELEDGMEYYDFDLSKAKIAHATNLQMSQIQVDQMSTAELIGKKEIILETYDLVYIGGNKSAFTPNPAPGKTWMNMYSFDASAFNEYMTNFVMYTHTGLLTSLTPGDAGFDAYGTLYSNESVDDTTGRKTRTGKITTWAEYGGNDLNNIKYEQLIKYVDAGMPIMVGKEAAEAFMESYAVRSNRLEQLSLRDIDPDCYMYQLLAHIYEKADKNKNSIAWNLDTTKSGETRIENSELKYGNTVTPDVCVFTEDVELTINTIVKDAAKHPTLVIEDAPLEYIEGNPSSYNETADGFEVDAYAKPSKENPSGTKFRLDLYIDVDGNGVFSDGLISGDGELAVSKEYTYEEGEDGKPKDIAQLNYTNFFEDFGEDFYGIISWKVVATELETGLVSSMTGYSYFKKPDDAERKVIRVLQIMPEDFDFAQGRHLSQGTYCDENLYFCIECQQAGHRLKYNPYSYANMTFETLQSSLVDVDPISDREYLLNSNQNNKMGLHWHKFGIVKYNSVTNNEDYETNLADVLSEDYDIQLEIMSAEEFSLFAKNITSYYGKLEAAVKEAEAEVRNASSDSELEAAKEKLKQAQDALDNALLDYQIQINGAPGVETAKAKLDAAKEAVVYAEKKLKEHMEGDLANCTEVNTNSGKYWGQQYYKQWAELGQYNRVFLYHPRDLTVNADTKPQMQKFLKLYEEYVTLNDAVILAEQEYKAAARMAYTTDMTLVANYDMIVLGFAENFAGQDLNNEACQLLKDYIARDGNILNTHDAMARYGNEGALTMTENLRDIFGMDRFHVTGIDNNISTGAGGGMPGTATITVDSFKYTEDVFESDPGRAEYQVNIITQTPMGVEEIKDGGKYTINSTDNVQYNLDITLNHYWAYDVGGVTSTTTALNENKVGFNINVRLGGGNPLDNNIAIEIKRVDNGNNYRLAYGVLDNNKVKFIIDHAMNVTPGKSTKPVTGSVLLSSSDKTLNVVTVPESSDANGSITVASTGSSKDISEPLIVRVKVNPPDASAYAENDIAKANAAEGTAVSLNFNNVDYNAAVKDGEAVFTVPQITGDPNLNNVTPSDKYRKFVTAGKGTGAAEFFTERAKTNNLTTWLKQMASKMSTWGYNVPAGLTYSALFGNMQTPEYTTAIMAPYAYVIYSINETTNFEKDRAWSTKAIIPHGAAGASQTNKGIVTVYPFTLSSELRIASTHSQAFQLDVEDEDIAVWYTLSPGRNDNLEGCSYVAASPHDTSNNYYIYSKGNIFFCGAAHAAVTGLYKDNNDERRLFLNVIVNSARTAGSPPKISLHEKDTNGKTVTSDKKDGNLFIDENGDYYYNVEGSTDTPEFDFKVRVDSKADLAEVLVYYDLDYRREINGVVNTSDDYLDNEDHVLITSYTKNTDITAQYLAEGNLGELRGDNYAKLKLKQSYFDPYDGKYTYIVIKATDSLGKVAYRRLKINLIPRLFDLTDANQNSNVMSVRYYVDMVDRRQFNI